MSKPSLKTVFNAAISLLGHTNELVHSYAAVFIEKCLGLKNIFEFLEILPANTRQFPEICENITVKVLTILKKEENTPICIYENEFLLKLLLRIIFSLKEAILPMTQLLFRELLLILQEVSKNPGNPKFNHFLFESLGALIYHAYKVCPIVDQMNLERAALPVFQQILQSDLAEFIPYVFLLVASINEFSAAPEGVPSNLIFLFEPLLTPAMWSSMPNVSSLTRLLQSYIFKSPALIVSQPKYLECVLGVFQTLLSSKAYDQFALDILVVIIFRLPAVSLEPYIRPIFVKLLQKAQTNKSPKFIKGFALFLANFICFFPDKSPEAKLLQILESIQPRFILDVFPLFIFCRLFVLVFTTFFTNTGPLFDAKERYLLCLAISKLLGHVELADVSGDLWLALLEKFVQLQTLGITVGATLSIENNILDSDEQSALVGSTVRLHSLPPTITISMMSHLPDAQGTMVQVLGSACMRPSVRPLLSSASPITIEYIRLLASKSGVIVI
jgi:exportin-2 (importin alpha re-exporter)